VSDQLNTNSAPYPAELADIVETMRYRPGWVFRLKDIDRGQGSEGLTFIVISQGFDTYNIDRGETYRVQHFFPVPPASYGRQSWERWVLDRLIEVETHEACEFFVVGDKRPFPPVHAPGWDPYAVREPLELEAAETSYKGERDEGSQA
jgi:hypothetical protein